MENEIIKINQLLVKRFGVPSRNSNLPNPLDMLIATILSQNTNDRNSYQAYKKLKTKFPAWTDAAEATRSQIEKEIKVAGLGNQKSKAIKNVLSFLQKKNAKISLDFILSLENNSAIEELTKFDGVGVKTASCVLLFSLDRNICPIDTHVHRTLNRIGLVKTKTPDKTFFAVNKDFPEKIAHSFHTNLIRLGREICRPQNPKCSICPLIKICKYQDKNLTEAIQSKSNEFMLLDNVS
ncbi:MAG: endonuclease III [Ignavibacteriales bacterium]|nr:endonuclease III [Ignavibacteriales bacterium]